MKKTRGTLCAAVLIVSSTAASTASPVPMRAAAPNVPICATRQAAEIAVRLSIIFADTVLAKLIEERYCMIVDPKTVMWVEEPDELISAASFEGANDKAYVVPGLLRPSDDLAPVITEREDDTGHRLLRNAYVCREAISAELYQSRIDVGDSAGATGIIEEAGCIELAAETSVKLGPYDTNEPDNMLGLERPVYKVEALVAGAPIIGYVPKKQVD